MALFEFKCAKCKNIYSEFTAFDKTGKYTKVKCPECNCKKKIKLISSCNFNFTNPVFTDRWCSDDTGHDYRYNYVQPSIRQKREDAEKMDHMGANPYNEIDDISGGENFGEVK